MHSMHKKVRILLNLNIELKKLSGSFLKQEVLTHLTTTMKLQQQQQQQAASLYSSGADASAVDSSVGASLQLLAKQAEIYKTYLAPDVTKFAYDERSGYYYDYTTGFYYDPNSQYYFNSMTQQFMYWDAAQSAYIPVTGGSGAAVASEAPTEPEKAVEETPKTVEAPKATEKPAKPKTAAQIAKVSLSLKIIISQYLNSLKIFLQ